MSIMDWVRKNKPKYDVYVVSEFNEEMSDGYALIGINIDISDIISKDLHINILSMGWSVSRIGEPFTITYHNGRSEEYFLRFNRHWIENRLAEKIGVYGISITTEGVVFKLRQDEISFVSYGIEKIRKLLDETVTEYNDYKEECEVSNKFMYDGLEDWRCILRSGKNDI